MRLYLRLTIYLIVLQCISIARAGSYDDFFQAVQRDDDREVARLLTQGFDPNSRNPKGQTALHLAMRDNLPKVAEVLWQHRQLDVDALNGDGETPMMMAALRGNTVWVRRLVDRGARVHKAGWSPVHYAATGPRSEVVALLLDRGAPIDAESPNRSTPLMMAARYGAEASVDLLLARGADARRKNDLGLTAVEFARQGGRDFLIARLQQAAQR